MVITVYSLKGGVGKTSLSMNIALELNYELIDNDPFGGVADIVNYNKSIKRATSIAENEEIPLRDNTVYDFGGFKDKRINNILVKSDVIILPTLHSYSDIKTTISAIEHLQNIGQHKIIVAINRINTASKRTQGSKSWYKDFKDTKDEVLKGMEHRNLNDVFFMGIRENKAWLNSTKKGRSLINIAQDSKLVEKNSTGAIEDLKTLLQVIEVYKG